VSAAGAYAGRAHPACWWWACFEAMHLTGMWHCRFFFFLQALAHRWRIQHGQLRRRHRAGSRLAPGHGHWIAHHGHHQRTDQEQVRATLRSMFVNDCNNLVCRAYVAYSLAQTLAGKIVDLSSCNVSVFFGEAHACRGPVRVLQLSLS
jgi:hypothetical protein